MSQHPCPLCSIDPAQAERTLLVYSPHQRLAARLTSVLDSAKISHRRDGALLTVQADGPEWRRMVVALLRDSLSPVEQKLIRIGRGSLAHIFGAPDLSTYAEIVNTEWFEKAVQNDRFSIYYQPIVDVAAGRTFAYECLIRLEAERIYSGSEIIEAATIRNEILEFDDYARRKAIASASAVAQRGTKLFINFFPSAMFEPEPCLEPTLQAIRDSMLDPSDIVFEIIECDQITNPDHTRRICEYFRCQGFRYAIDDLGTGTNSLEMIEVLRPDYVKIDKSIVWNLSDPVRLETVRLAVVLAQKMGAQVIAEGIESSRMAVDVRQLGIHLMQGYSFGKPSPVMSCESGSTLLRDLMRLSDAVTSSSVPQKVPVPAVASSTPGIPS